MKQLSLSLIVVLLLQPATAFAQTSEECTQRYVEDLKKVHDTYRSYLFGSRQDDDGEFTVLTGGKTDAEREGIFETKRRLGSELVEPLVDAYRTYRCKSLYVCSRVGESLTSSDASPVDLRLLGCTEAQGVERYPECYFAGTAETGVGSADASDQLAPLQLVDQCKSMVDRTLAAERSVLRLAVAYDSGYRSMLQFAGIMDWMLDGFPTQAVRAISDMVNMLGKLYQIPCFIGQCDDPDSDFLTP